MTKRMQGTAVDLWLGGLALRSRPFLPGNSTTVVEDLSGPDGRIVNRAFEFRMGQAVMSVGTARMALEAVLTGYYSQALALSRMLFESWKRAAYIRNRPMEVSRWMSESWIGEDLTKNESSQRLSDKLSKAEWDAVFPNGLPENSVGANDRQILDLVKEYIDDLHEHVHPTFAGYSQHIGAARNQVNLFPSFSDHNARQALHLGNVIEFCLIWELPHLLQLDAKWHSDADEWRQDLTRIYANRVFVNVTDNAQ